ncbi:MAG: ribosome silencing factor [Crocinitomicaceae bacterium]|jgi:ribosome-associated protein|nr:ribosome silencing factor [Crocinitomicaceae bacterium]
MTETQKVKKSQVLCDMIVEGMQENKAQDIVVLDLRDIPNTVTEFFVICTGESSTQIDGITSSVIRHTRKSIQEKPWHTEGKGTSEWVLIDYVSVVAHVFYKSARSHYDLEDLWSDAKKIEIPNLY